MVRVTDPGEQPTERVKRRSGGSGGSVDGETTAPVRTSQRLILRKASDVGLPDDKPLVKAGCPDAGMPDLTTANNPPVCFVDDSKLGVKSEKPFDADDGLDLDQIRRSELQSVDDRLKISILVKEEGQQVTCPSSLSSVDVGKSLTVESCPIAAKVETDGAVADESGAASPATDCFSPKVRACGPCGRRVVPFFLPVPTSFPSTIHCRGQSKPVFSYIQVPFVQQK